MISLPSGEHVRVVETGFSRGRPIIFLHGWGACAWTFNRMLPAVAAAGFRAIAIDLRGHGLSGKPVGHAPYTTGAIVEQVEQALDVLGLDRPAVVGHSMGAAVAMHVVLRERRAVRGIALLAPVGFGTARHVVLARSLSPAWTAPVSRLALRRGVVARILDATYGTLGSYDERDVDELWAPAQFPGFVPAMRHLVHHFRWTPFTWEELLAVRTPALVIRGDADGLIAPPTESLARYAGAREMIIPGAGHLVHDEAAAEVNATLIRFLDEAWK
jgi:pimeloyl-ACP methyl ester carboxylesterase